MNPKKWLLRKTSETELSYENNTCETKRTMQFVLCLKYPLHNSFQKIEISILPLGDM
jgi:hypothetical protein